MWGNLAAKIEKRAGKREANAKIKSLFIIFVIIILIFYRDLSLMGL